MITLSPTDDMGIIRDLVTRPDIWERISDTEDSEGFIPTTDYLNKWILVLNDTSIIGVIYINVETNCAIQFHPYLMKEHRKHGAEMVKAFFEWFICNTPENYIKINVIIPECFKSVLNFAEKVGFKEEGVCRKSYIKKGHAYDRHFYGITREEIEG